MVSAGPTVKQEKQKMVVIESDQAQKRQMLIVQDLLKLKNVKILPAQTLYLEKNGNVADLNPLGNNE